MNRLSHKSVSVGWGQFRILQLYFSRCYSSFRQTDFIHLENPLPWFNDAVDEDM